MLRTKARRTLNNVRDDQVEEVADQFTDYLNRNAARYGLNDHEMAAGFAALAGHDDDENDRFGRMIARRLA